MNTYKTLNSIMADKTEDYEDESCLNFINATDWKIQLVSNKPVTENYYYKVGEDGGWTSRLIKTLSATDVNDGYIDVPANIKIYFKRYQDYLGTASAMFRFKVSGDNVAFIASGNVASLMHGNDAVLDKYGCYRLFSNTPIKQFHARFPFSSLSAYACGEMFSNCTKLTTVKSDMLQNVMYLNTTNGTQFGSMFDGCTSLTNVLTYPKLTSLPQQCCQYMYRGCTALTYVPVGLFSGMTGYKSNYACAGMFENCTSLRSVPKLPPGTAPSRGYQWMFYGCTSLATVPADMLGEPNYIYSEAYRYMFGNCTSLKTPPSSIPSSKCYGTYCYHYMFDHCSSLSTIPKLPATILTDNCYCGMFNGCTSLKSIPNGYIASATLANDCYTAMFAETGLTAVPDIFHNITVTAPNCFRMMFYDCKSLSSVPADMFETIVKHSQGECDGMFQGCSALTATPTLTIQTAQKNCYNAMFLDCTNLTQAAMLLPSDPEDLAEGCFNYMFNGCKKLTSLSTQMKSWTKSVNGKTVNFTTNWMNYIKTNGTFYCPPELEEKYGNNYIPSTWTREIISYSPAKTGIDTRRIGGDSTINTILSGTTNVIILPEKPNQVFGGKGVIISIGGKKKKFNSTGSGSSKRYSITDVETNRVQQSNIVGPSTIINNKAYTIIDLHEYPDPLCLSSISKEDYNVEIKNIKTDQIWAVVTKDPENDAIMGVYDCTSTMTIPIQGNYQAYIYNLGTGDQLTINRTMIRTSPSSVPIYLGGQFNSLSGYARQNKNFYTNQFYKMFYNFEGLTKIDSSTIIPISANTGILPRYFSYAMFMNCKNLTGDLTFNPNLGSTLSCGSYNFAYMFQNCHKLANITNGLTINGGPYCCQQMFYKCYSLPTITLTQAPTTLSSYTAGNYNFADMFNGCSSLVNPNITLYLHEETGTYNYSNMFIGCSSLVVEPTFQSASSVFLRQGCFYRTFSGCKQIQDYNFPANVVEYDKACYKQTFSGCINLNLGVPSGLPVYTPSSVGIRYPNYYGLAGDSDSTFAMSANHGSFRAAGGWLKISTASGTSWGGCMGMRVTSGGYDYSPYLGLHRTGECDCGNTWFLPINDQGYHTISTSVQWQAPTSACHVAFKVFKDSGPYVRYPNYNALVGSMPYYDMWSTSGEMGETGNVQRNQWVDWVDSGGWLLINVLCASYSGSKIQLVTRNGEGTTKSIDLFTFGGYNGPRTTWLIPIDQDFMIRSSVKLQRIQFQPAVGGNIGFPDYGELANTRRGRIPHGQSFSTPCDGWVRISAVSGHCVRFSINGRQWNWGLPLYSSRAPAGHSTGGYTYLLPVQRGTSIKWICADSGGRSGEDKGDVFVKFAPNCDTTVEQGYKGQGDWSMMPELNSERGFNSQSFGQTFIGCSGLTYAPVFPANITYRSTNELSGMFRNCGNLQAIRWKSPTVSMLDTKHCANLINVGSGILYTNNQRDSYATSTELNIPTAWARIKVQ